MNLFLILCCERKRLDLKEHAMSSLEIRLKKLETAACTMRLAKLSDAELDAHILTLMDESPGWYDAIIARVMRHPSTIPVVKDDPAHKLFCGQGDRV